MTLSEQHRPKTLDAVIGQEKIVAVLSRLQANGSLLGRALYFYGKSGIGKSTLAEIIAATVASPMYITRTTGRELTAAVVRDWFKQTAFSPLFGNGYALIVNESHGLSKPAIEVLLDVMEQLDGKKAVICFTTTKDGNDLFEDTQLDAAPFASRCLTFKLTDQGLAPKFAAHVRAIAQAAGLDGKPEAAYVKLAYDCGLNLREMLKRVEQGVMLS